ncbi:ENTH domain protein [Ostertagia ostertagi]
MSDLLSGISSLTKQISNNIPYQIKKLGESVHTIVMNYTEAENLVYEATNEDPWGPTGPQMKEIANYTFQYDGFHQVTNLLWKRMLEDNKNAWRRVYKSLTLLNHLLFHGSERVIGNARDHMFQMRSLEQYKYVDERGRDQGLNVRHRVKVILELLSDDDKLRAQRKKMKSDNKERYQGYTSDDIRIGRGGAYNSSSINSYSDEWKDDSDSYKNRSSYDDSRDDYSSKEVNSFQFPDETRRGSASPELGFRQEPTPEEDFGDFASARSVPQPTTTAQVTGTIKSEALHIPAIRPPAPVSAPSRTKSPASIDLLGLDAPSATTSSIPPLDFFGAPAQVQSSPIRPPRPPSGDGGVQSVSKPALADNLFLSSPPAQVTSDNAFV